MLKFLFSELSSRDPSSITVAEVTGIRVNRGFHECFLAELAYELWFLIVYINFYIVMHLWPHAMTPCTKTQVAASLLDNDCRLDHCNIQCHNEYKVIIIFALYHLIWQHGKGRKKRSIHQTDLSTDRSQTSPDHTFSAPSIYLNYGPWPVVKPLTWQQRLIRLHRIASNHIESY